MDVNRAARVWEAMSELCGDCGHHVHGHADVVFEDPTGNWSCIIMDCPCVRTRESFTEPRRRR